MFGQLHRCTSSLKHISSTNSLKHISCTNSLKHISGTNSLRRISVTSKKLYTTCKLFKELHVKSKVASNFIPYCQFSSVVEDVLHDDDGETDPSMLEEIKKYNTSKRWLARMMGADADTFTQKDIDEAIQYLLPSHLWAKDARPSMKHPYEYLPISKLPQFDKNDRPHEAAFYTHHPKYSNLVFEIWSHMERLDNPVHEGDAGLSLSETITYLENKNEDLTVVDNPVLEGDAGLDLSETITSVENENENLTVVPKDMQWATKLQLEEMLKERMSHKSYDVIIFRLKKLATHKRAKEAQHFLQQFQVSAYTSGKGRLDDVDVYGTSARAMGQRKTSTAEVVIHEGSGTITVNDKPLIEYFVNTNDVDQIMFPLLVVNKLNRFRIEAHVIGGGHSGQSGAIRYAMSLAIAALHPEHYDELNDACLLIRDYRQKERKKPGRKKARRKFQWRRR